MKNLQSSPQKHSQHYNKLEFHTKRWETEKSWCQWLAITWWLSKIVISDTHNDHRGYNNPTKWHDKLWNNWEFTPQVFLYRVAQFLWVNPNILKRRTCVAKCRSNRPSRLWFSFGLGHNRCVKGLPWHHLQVGIRQYQEYNGKTHKGIPLKNIFVQFGFTKHTSKPVKKLFNVCLALNPSQTLHVASRWTLEMKLLVRSLLCPSHCYFTHRWCNKER